MLLFLILVYLTNNITHGRTLPLEAWSDALSTRLDGKYLDDRTVWSIVWSCFTTLFACSWVAVHANVPSVKDSDDRILGRRLAMMGYMLLAPECIIIWAARQHFGAKEIAAKHQLKGWTRTHGFFIIMGGFALHNADKSFLCILDESTLEELDSAGKIEWPTITEKEIQDRSKADIFSKGIVLLQTTWFIIQCISRFATKLAVTELEVVTLAFAVLNGFTYWLWWDKPSDVRCAVPVYLKSTASNPRLATVAPIENTGQDLFLSPASLGESFSNRYHEHGLLPAIFYTFIWTPIKVVFGPLWAMTYQDEILDDDITRIPTFYSPKETVRVLGLTPLGWTIIGVIALFGAIHFAPWSSTFPTAAEKRLWKISTIMITGGPLLLFFSIIITEWVSNPILETSLEFSVFSMFVILIAAYLMSRIILLILPLILLRNLPPTALLELKWSKYFPHI